MMKTRLGFAIYLVLILLAGGAIAAPSISDHSPASDPTSTVGENQDFSVNINETSNVTWYLNNVELETDESVTTASYSNDTAPAGSYEVKVVAENGNGSDEYTWTWTVSNAANETVAITDSNPTDDTPDSTTGDTVEFNITLNQEAAIRWLINSVEMDTDTGVSSSYSNNTAPAGTYNVTAIASNVNGTDQKTWDWTVAEAENETVTITDFNPTDTTPDSTAGETVKFNITLNQKATIRWLIDSVEMDTDTGSSSSYSNNTAPAGEYNVTAIATNDSNSDQQEWTWTVAEAENESLKITDFSPEDNPSSVVDAYQNFTVETNQDADIKWYIDGELDHTNSSVSFAALNVSDKAIGSYNVTAIASNANGTDQQKWTWTVASKTYLSGDRIWDADANQSLDYTWTALSYSGFYYDLDTGEGSETMTIHLDSDSDRSIEEGDLEYETTPITTEFQYNKWGDYQVIGFMAEKYFAGYLDNTEFADANSIISNGILSKVLIDENDKKSVYAGSSLTLENGYALNLVEADVNGNNVYVTLSKDGSQVDETVVKDNGTYIYKAELGDTGDEIPIIAVHFGNIFQGQESSAVFVDAIFQISDDYISIDSGDNYGVMELKTVSDEKITMENADSISLSKGKTASIMGKLKFTVADSSTLRFAPFVDMSEAGTYELRGTVSEDEAFEWTPLNFEGFYYNIDEGIGTEKLEITKLSSRTIDDGDLVYTSTPENVSFQYDNWGNFDVIGFMAEKYFAGYPDNDFTDSLSLVSQGQLSKVLLDESDKTSLTSGTSLTLEEGYALNIEEVDINGKNVHVSLTKDGSEVDDDIIASGETYVYKTELGDVDDVPIIVVHFQDVFQGSESSAVFVDGIFQISDEYVSVGTDDSFNKMDVTSVDESGITMKNQDSISLTKGKEILVMGNISFKVADTSDTVRFYPFVEVKTASSNSLEIQTNEVVTQGTAMKIAVTSRGMAVSNATLTIGSKTIGSTSTTGIVQYTPDTIGNFTINAEKDGYVSGTAKFEVISSQDESRKMTIDITPDEIYAGTNVKFLILKAIGGEAIEGAQITLDGNPIGNTSKDGNITYTLTGIGMHKLTASKSGLIDAELNFEVKELAAKFIFTNLQISPLEVKAGDEATISVNVSNTGTAPGNYTVELKVNGTTVSSQAVTLNNGNSTTLKFVHAEEEPGTYNISVQDLKGSYVVLKKSSAIWYVLGGIILLAAAGVGYLFTAGGWTVEMAKAKINEFIGSIR
ncbi:S-layer protein domain-containing protein [uncultured Methanomethylovorans sp.]|uniref:S-layer protein domain-containing protein n=1 Tax=uncultured Methanomethylovorans sp. TaxID=183759 RepID=UPI002AA76FB4|nr:S-layer protein domain-containing protein [uncultured Methanomethylovorans sp.]